ncbi:MAG: hypothetical protein CSA20_02420 [Deltaproteobacteria bacterium]|nr:MAG: hypothetical protein CSB23_02090 [Deltaproteobacteria bacterium]PIE73589.1 MAG: hypothetical protein CSA20_02420 [Deltaproteobacteria bacterium]
MVSKKGTYREISCFYALFFVILSLWDYGHCATNEGIVPERDLTVTNEKAAIPEWKTFWDDARALVRQERYQQAKQTYARLFALRPEVEEASWEYCKVLLELKEYKTAHKIISWLLEIQPSKQEYLLVAGKIAAQEKHYIEAKTHFGNLLALAPLGQYSTEALHGLAYALRASGKRKEAFPLLQQLLIRQSEQENLRQDLAEDAVILGKRALARRLYLELIADEGVDDTVIVRAVDLFARIGDSEAKMAAWKIFLERHPGYEPFRLSLIEELVHAGSYADAMSQYDMLIARSKEAGQYLLKAAELAEKYLKRADKALVYLDAFCKLHPEDLASLQRIQRIEKQLAEEFIVIAQNDGAELLWADLEKLSSNRVAIFSQMAVLLRAQNAGKALTDVLEVLYHNQAKSPRLALELAKLLNAQKEYSKSLVYLEDLPAKIEESEVLLLKADNEMQLGDEPGALHSLMAVMRAHPEDHDLAFRCLEIAGLLGFIDQQKEIFAVLLEQFNGSLPPEIVIRYVQLLVINGFYEEALYKCNWALDQYSAAEVVLSLRFLKALSLRESGRALEAEQSLRVLLAVPGTRDNVLLQLAENAIEDKDFRAARIWLEAIQGERHVPLNRLYRISFQHRLLLVRSQLAIFAGEIDEARALLQNAERDIGLFSGSMDLGLEKEVLLQQIASVQGASSRGLIHFEGSGVVGFSPEIFVLQEARLSERKKGKKHQELEKELYQRGGLLCTRALAVVEREIDLGYFTLAQTHIDLLLPRIPDSARLLRSQMRIYVEEGSLDQAKRVADKLRTSYGDESSFCLDSMDLDARSRDYTKALAMFHSCFGTETVDRKIPGSQEPDYRLIVYYARLLWGAGQRERALAVYETLLTPSAYEKLIGEFASRNINYQYLTRDQTLWNSMLLLLESDPEIIAELIQPEFQIDNLDNDAGQIVADNYASYRWQDRIGEELSARKAAYERNYRYAVKSYEKLLKKEDTIASKIDLARMYGRISQYRKGAMVYKEISSETPVTPELAESIRRNFLRIRPTNTIDFTLHERQGREGDVDIRKETVGSSFRLSPLLSQDVTLGITNSKYKSKIRQGSLTTNGLFAGIVQDFADDYEFKARLSGEKGSSARSWICYDLAIEGNIDDYVSGHLRFGKEMVDDSVDAVAANLYRQYLQTGLTIETQLGVTFGGDVKYSIYSDDNEQKYFSLFSSYTYFGDLFQLDLKYNFDYFLNNTDGSKLLPDLIDEGRNAANMYWRPEFYSQHTVRAEFKKDFYGYLSDAENKMSYVKCGTGLRLEDNSTLVYLTDLDIFLEMSPHLLLKGSFKLHTGDPVDEKMLLFSLQYSW